MSAFGTKRTCQSLSACPLSGVKRTLIGGAPMSAYDPKRTLFSPLPLRCTTSLPNIGGTKLGHLRWWLLRFLRCAILGLLKVPGHAKDRRYLFDDYRTRRRCSLPSADRGLWLTPRTVSFRFAACRAPLSPPSPVHAG